jgi:hypothetical protein
LPASCFYDLKNAWEESFPELRKNLIKITTEIRALRIAYESGNRNVNYAAVVNMNFVIRHPISKLYYRATGQWVLDWTEAQQFSDAGTAVDFCIFQRFENYQIMRKGVRGEAYGRVLRERVQYPRNVPLKDPSIA